MEIKSLLWNPNRNIVIRKKKKELKRKPSSMASNHHYHNRQNGILPGLEDQWDSLALIRYNSK